MEHANEKCGNAPDIGEDILLRSVMIEVDQGEPIAASASLNAIDC